MDKKLTFCLSAAALLFIVAGSYLFYTTYLFMRDAIILEGVVVEIRTMRSESTGTGRPGLVQRPVVEYLPPKGEPRRFMPRVGSFKSRFNPGERLEVLYTPQNTQPARLKAFSTTWLFPLILWGMGLLLAGVTLLLKKIMPMKA